MTATENGKLPSRMPIDRTRYVRKIVSLEHALWREIDDLRFERRLRTDNAVLKLLIETGLRTIREEREAEPPPPRKRGR